MAKNRIRRIVDFCGFQFNGFHSSELGITRVSDGSRYNENLVPNFTDKTAQVVGGDGMLYWDSFYSQKTWNINVAFDDLSESEYRKLRQVFNGKSRGELIFDETPYKAYSVKVQSPPQWKTLCFDEKVENVFDTIEGNISSDGNIPMEFSRNGKTYRIIEADHIYIETTNLANMIWTPNIKDSTIIIGKDNADWFYRIYGEIIEIGNDRVYKGEGTIQFISYYPYARSIYKYIEDYENANANFRVNNKDKLSSTLNDGKPVIGRTGDKNDLDKYVERYVPYPNIKEWERASLMLPKKNGYDQTCIELCKNSSKDTLTTYTIDLYNPGDAEAEWVMYFYLLGKDSSSVPKSIILQDEANNILGQLHFSQIVPSLSNAQYLAINSRTNMMEACTSIPLTGLPSSGSEYIEVSSTVASSTVASKTISVRPQLKTARTITDIIDSILESKFNGKISNALSQPASFVESFASAACAKTYEWTKPTTKVANISFLSTKSRYAWQDEIAFEDAQISGAAVGAASEGPYTGILNNKTLADIVRNEQVTNRDKMMQGIAEHLSVIYNAGNAKSGNKLYNNYLKAGDFFKIPVGKFKLVVTMYTETKQHPGFDHLEYNYLYY